MIISPTRTPVIAALIAMLTSVWGSSPGATGDSGIPITVAAGHGSPSLVALQGGEPFRKSVDHIFIEEEPK